jgi:glycerol-3-phosphate dehydrogenase
MRPGKGVHLTLDRRFSNYGILCSAVDGRQMFLLPHENDSIVGTTDDDYYGDPDDLEATNDEVEYLLEGVESLLPDVRRARVTRAWCGLRTTLYEYGKNEDALSREHLFYDGAAEGAAGLLSLVGGKLASYRAQSEEATDRILALLGRPEGRCRTHVEPLPGGEETPDPLALAKDGRIAAPAAARIVYRHGARAREIVRMAAEDPRLALVLCRDEGILAAEVAFCCREEMVRRLRDLRSRCRLAVGACGGLDCARIAAQLAGRELGWTPDRVRAELADLLDLGWRERRPVLDGHQLAQEELLRGAHAGMGGR